MLPLAKEGRLSYFVPCVVPQKQPNMKVVLRNRATELYLLGENMWTNDPGRAFDFGRAERAAAVAKRAGLRDMEMILSVSGVPEGIRLPVDAESPKAFGE